MSKKTLKIKHFQKLDCTNIMPTIPPNITLASGSRYRQQQLTQLQLKFTASPTHIDEEALINEPACALAQRLAKAKAWAASANGIGGLIIGCDQTAECGGRVLGKPGTAENAQEQLRFCSGREVRFHSAICLLRTEDHFQQLQCIETHVQFRPLNNEQIARYIAREKPLDCAGSFKCEGLGIALFESITSEDPTALIGLPLIALTTMLTKAGIQLL